MRERGVCVWVRRRGEKGTFCLALQLSMLMPPIAGGGRVRAVRLRTSYTLTHTRRVCTYSASGESTCKYYYVGAVCLPTLSEAIFVSSSLHPPRRTPFTTCREGRGGSGALKTQ